MRLFKDLLEKLNLINTQEQNQIARDAYNQAITQSWHKNFKHQANEIHKNLQSIDFELAAEASAERSFIKYKIQSEYNTVLERYFLNARDFFKGTTFKNSEAAFYSAFKTGGGDLGLQNNGFHHELTAWNILKQCDINNIYPENITADTSIVEGFTIEFENHCPDPSYVVELLGNNLDI